MNVPTLCGDIIQTVKFENNKINNNIMYQICDKIIFTFRINILNRYCNILFQNNVQNLYS